MKILYRTIQMVLFIGVLSCGPRKVTMGAASPEDAAMAAVIAGHYEHEPDFQTLVGKLNVEYLSEERDQRLTVNFRMKKDDTIWMSGNLLGIPLAKVLITPTSVQFYEKISGTYFDGDFRLLSEFLGTPLDYNKVQNLLLGQTIYDLREERYVFNESPRGYELTPAQQKLLKKLFLLDANNFRALAQQIGETGSARSVTITYPEYQLVEGRLLPARIGIIANEGAMNTRINMEFRGMNVNVPVSFPFSIPSGFDEISLE